MDHKKNKFPSGDPTMKICHREHYRLASRSPIVFSALLILHEFSPPAHKEKTMGEVFNVSTDLMQCDQLISTKNCFGVVNGRYKYSTTDSFLFDTIDPIFFFDPLTTFSRSCFPDYADSTDGRYNSM